MSRDRALTPGVKSVAAILHIGLIERAGPGCTMNSVCNSEVRRHIEVPMSPQNTHANRRCDLIESMTGLIASSPSDLPPGKVRAGEREGICLRNTTTGGRRQAPGPCNYVRCVTLRRAPRPR